MERAKNSKFGSFALFMTAVPLPAIAGYQFIIFNPITPVLQTIFNETYLSRFGQPIPDLTWTSLLSITSTAIVIGGFIGALCMKPLLGCMSRKRLMQTCHVISLVSIILVALVGKLTGAYEVFIIGRIVTGFPLGIMYSLTPLMVAEMSARNKQSFWQAMVGVAIGLGLLIGAIFAHPKVLGSYDLWPVAVALSGILSIVYLISSYWIPNTVSYVMRQGNKDNTIDLLKRMREGNKATFENEYEAMELEMKGCDVVGIIEVVKTKQYRRQLIMVFCLFANLMLCGVNNFTFYSDQLFIRAGISPDNVTFGTIGVFALQFVMSVVGTKLVRRYGGRKMLLIASCGQIFALILLLVSQATLHLAPHILGYVAIVAAAIFFSCWSGGTNLATLALLGAVTIEPTRQAILGVGGIPLWLFSLFVGIIPPYLEIGSIAYSMVLWLVCSIIFFVYFIIFLPETKGRTIDQIQQKFKARRSQSCAPITAEERL